MKTITSSVEKAKAELQSGHPLRAATALDGAVYETWDPEELQAIDELANPNSDRGGVLSRTFFRDAHTEARLRLEHPDFRPAEFHPGDIVRRRVRDAQPPIAGRSH